MFQFLFFLIVLVGYYVGFSSLSHLLKKDGSQYGFKIAGIGIGLTAAISQLVIGNMIISASVAIGTWLFAIGSMVVRKFAVSSVNP